MSEVSNDQKKINARVMKWRQMLVEGLYNNLDLLVKRTKKGIPKSMRIKVWPQLAKIDKLMERKSLSYSKVLIKDSFDIYDINLDIPRTFSFEDQEILQQSLFNVLKALSIEFPEIGYCQGMNFLTMRLLQVMDDDTVFYLLCTLLRRHKPIYDNFRNPGYVGKQNYVFGILLKQFMPKTEKILRQHSLDPVLYTPSWFLTLFSKPFPQQKFCRFFQCFLVQGYSFMYKMALTMIKLKEKSINSNSMQQNFTFVPDLSYYDDIDADTLISTAVKFQFDDKHIKKLEDEYSKKNKKQIETLEKSSSESYQKKLKCPRKAFQWTLEDFHKTEAELIKFDQ